MQRLYSFVLVLKAQTRRWSILEQPSQFSRVTSHEHVGVKEAIARSSGQTCYTEDSRTEIAKKAMHTSSEEQPQVEGATT